MTILTLVRHGTTEWIEAGRLHGISDSPLSARGRREAAAVAQALMGQQFDAFYTSSLGRAQETAAIIGQAIGMQAVPLESLREINFGWMEGGPVFDFSEDPPLKRALRSNWLTVVLQLSGEPGSKFGARVAQAAREIALRHPDQRVLLVVHNGVRNFILARLVDGDPGAYVRYDSWPACAYTEIELTPDGSARLIRLNVSDHLSSILAS